MFFLFDIKFEEKISNYHNESMNYEHYLQV